MHIQENIVLAPYTSFKIGGPAKYFCNVTSRLDLAEALQFAKEHAVPIFILGGGSNVVVSDSGFAGLVIYMQTHGFKVFQETPDTIFISVQAGQSWDELVAFCVSKNYAGIENLSHIPGSTGAVAVQNVGAYGQEACEVIKKITAVSVLDGTEVIFENQECQFAYRSSIFNTTHKGQYVIWEIIFELKKHGLVTLQYKDLQQKFLNKKPSLPQVRQAVIAIRDKKFPFPSEAVNGNVGSFFKNPIMTVERFIEVKNKVTLEFGQQIVEQLEKRIFYEDGLIKIPAAYLLDIAGLKNLSVGGAAVNATQPLVILNANGSATADDVVDLAKTIQHKIYNKTTVQLKAEPEFLGLNAGSLK